MTGSTFSPVCKNPIPQIPRGYILEKVKEEDPTRNRLRSANTGSTVEMVLTQKSYT